MISKKEIYQFFEDKMAKRNRVYIIPTKLGITYTLINFAIFMMAIVYANNMTLFMSFIFVAYLVIEMITTNNDLLNFEITSIKMQDCFVDQDQVCNIYLKEILDLNNINIHFLEYVFPLSSKNYENCLEFIVKLNKRGLYHSNKIKISHKTNSGLFTSWKYFNIPLEVYVYPSLAPVNINQTHYKNTDTYQGDFSYHVPYQIEFSANRIDWKIYAKSDELYWKKDENKSQNNFEFDFDKISGLYEERLSKLSYLIFSAYKTNSHWQLKVQNDLLPTSKGNSHYINSMRLIASREFQ